VALPAPSAPRPSPSPATRARGLGASFVYAWNGLIHTLVYQRNMKLHFSAAVLVSLVGSGMPLGLAEKTTLIFCVMLVFFAEILNTALEHLVDLATSALDERARVAKDTAAGGVLVLSIGTFIIFAALVFHNAPTVAAHTNEIARQTALGVPLTASIGGLLLARRRAAWIDHLLVVVAVGVWLALALRTYSVVFSAMTLGLVVTAAAAARVRRTSGPRA